MHTLTVMESRKNNKSLFELMNNEPEFNVLSGEEMDLLDRIMLVNTYANGYKFRSADNIYLLIDGEVIVIHRRLRDPLHYENMHIGEFFDLFSLVDKKRRATECFAVGTVRAASLPRVVFDMIIRANIPLSLHFRQIITKQVMRYFAVPDRHSHYCRSGDRRVLA